MTVAAGVEKGVSTSDDDHSTRIEAFPDAKAHGRVDAGELLTGDGPPARCQRTERDHDRQTSSAVRHVPHWAHELPVKGRKKTPSL